MVEEGHKDFRGRKGFQRDSKGFMRNQLYSFAAKKDDEYDQPASQTNVLAAVGTQPTNILLFASTINISRISNLSMLFLVIRVTQAIEQGKERLK